MSLPEGLPEACPGCGSVVEPTQEGPWHGRSCGLYRVGRWGLHEECEQWKARALAAEAVLEQIRSLSGRRP